MSPNLSGSALAAGDGKFVFPRKPAASAVPLTCKIKQLGAKVDRIGRQPLETFTGRSASPRRATPLTILVQQLVTTLRVVTHILDALRPRTRITGRDNVFRSRDAKRPVSAFPREAWERGQSCDAPSPKTFLSPPSGASLRRPFVFQGLTPLATPCRPYGTLTTPKFGDEPFYWRLPNSGPGCSMAWVRAGRVSTRFRMRRVKTDCRREGRCEPIEIGPCHPRRTRTNGVSGKGR